MKRKKYSKIILPGGSGFLGKALVDYFKNYAEEIVILTRGKTHTAGNIKWIHWDGKNKDKWFSELEGADLLVNLTGKNVNYRYTQKNKNEILSSRIDAIKILGEALRVMQKSPDYGTLRQLLPSCRRQTDG
jgi:NAD dependent epimerase/dehydratase family enzyme